MRIGEVLGAGYPRLQIFRECGVVGGREGDSMLEAIASGCRADRSFGDDMDRVRCGSVDAAGHLPARKNGERYLRICGAGNTAKSDRRYDLGSMPEQF